MELKAAIDNVKQAKTLLSDANNIMSASRSRLMNAELDNARLEKERAELRQENAALKADLDDWKGNAEGFEPDAYMRLPLDADGVPIRLDDTVWYVGPDIEITNDDPQQVVGLVTVFAADGIYVMTRDFTDKAIRPNMLTHRGPEPPDSWEKLIGDLRDAVSSSKYACECAYLNPEEGNCEKCPALNQVCSGYAIADILARIERLRGEGND